MDFLSAGTNKEAVVERWASAEVRLYRSCPFFFLFFISHGIFCFFVCLFLTRVASSCLHFVLFIIRGSFFIQQSEPL